MPSFCCPLLKFRFVLVLELNLGRVFFPDLEVSEFLYGELRRFHLSVRVLWRGLPEGVVPSTKKIEKKEHYNHESNDVAFNEVTSTSKLVLKSCALLRNINKITW